MQSPREERRSRDRARGYESDHALLAAHVLEGLLAERVVRLLVGLLYSGGALDPTAALCSHLGSVKNAADAISIIKNISDAV